MSGKLPKGWVNVTLAEIAQINPKHLKELDNSLPVTFTAMPALSERSHKFTYTEQRRLGEVRKGYTHFADGDVLFSKITPCMENEKAAVADKMINGIGCGTTELQCIETKRRCPEFLFSLSLYTSESVGGSGRSLYWYCRATPRACVFISEKIPLPPFDEQRRIVAKLEILLEKVDASRERLEKIPAILKRFRQSVLAAACSGRANRDWRKQTHQ